jgi:predicted nucleotide-binding protein (sugar kinase/HSP70/actin superfamily)
VPIVSPIRFGAFPEKLGLDALVRSLSRWRIARRAVREALSSAREAEERFERAVRSRGEVMIGSLGEGGRAVVVLGRPYSARMLPGEARRALASGGVAIVPQDFLQPSEDDLRAAAREMHWDCGRRILAAARTVARDGRLGAVYLTHARCGPDSFILKYTREILDGRPWMALELPPGDDDPAPLVERCAAFRAAWDAQYEPGPAAVTAGLPVGRANAPGRSPQPREIPEHAEPPRKKDVKTLIHFPDMGVAAETGVAALSAFDIEGEVVRADEESLRAAAGYTSGDECLPYVVTIGNLVKTARAGSFDPARAAFFMATSSGSCRFGQYRRGFRMCLDALGHDDIRVISLNQSEEKTKQMPGLGFGLLLWKGLTALGAVEQVAMHVRPRASDPEEADRARDESRDDVLGCLRRRRDPREALVRAASRFGSVGIDPGALPVTIALTGEIFVRLQPFSNSGVVRLIEEAGGEVVMPPFEEWLHHVSRCIWLAARAHGRGMAQLKLRAAEWYMRRGERRARDVLRHSGAPVPPSQPEIEEIWRASNEAGFIPWFGDASISLGRAISMRRRGARGVVNLVPYGCLPGTTSEAVFAARRDALRGIPVLHLSLDGGPGPEVRERVMALVEAAKGYSPPPEPPRPRPRKRYIRPPIHRFWTVD